MSTVPEWGRYNPSFTHLKKCFNLTISKIEKSFLNQVFISPKLPIQGQTDWKTKNFFKKYDLTQSVI